MAANKELVNQESSKDLTRFRPEETKKNDAKLKAVIGAAKEMKDWPLLEKAVDHQIKEQRQFVEWWGANVRDAHRGKPRADRGVVYSMAEAEKKTEIKHQQVSRWKKWLEDEEKYRARVKGAAYAKAMGTADPGLVAGRWTGEEAWYTPARYIEAVKKVMGGVDLDPASHDFAQEIVGAAEYFTKKENGLERQWHGRVFLNPPYQMPEIRKFVEKICLEYSDGNISEGILLTNNNTDTSWWHLAAKVACTLCCTEGRISFYNEDGESSSPTNGQTFFYFGSNEKKFAEIFCDVGIILTVI